MLISSLHRLTLQHKAITKSLSGSLLLLPEDVLSRLNSEHAKVLDVGTGNAVWLSAFHDSISSTAQLVGIDIERRMWPARYPPQMRFEVGSVLDLPASWSGEFDLVHQNLLIAALKASEWPAAISEVFRVLQSGGFVHFLEYGDMQNMAVGPQTTRVLDIAIKLFAMGSLDFDLAARLPSLVRAAGFSDVLVHDVEWGLHGQSNRLRRENALKAHNAIKDTVVKCGLVGSTDDYDNLMASAEEEWESSPGKALIIRVITGRKQ